MASNLYRGFSTKQTSGVYTALFDIDLVNQDIVNQFNTPLRSRVGRANFGSIIPLLLFELGDSTTEGLINSDINRVIASDPRVSLIRKVVQVDLDQHEVIARIELNYIELSLQNWLDVRIRLS